MSNSTMQIFVKRRQSRQVGDNIVEIYDEVPGFDAVLVHGLCIRAHKQESQDLHDNERAVEGFVKPWTLDIPKRGTAPKNVSQSRNANSRADLDPCTLWPLRLVGGKAEVAVMGG